MFSESGKKCIFIKFSTPDIGSMSGSKWFLAFNPFVLSFAGSFVRPSVSLVSVIWFVNLTSKFWVKPLLVSHISVTTYQILFIFGS